LCIKVTTKMRSWAVSSSIVLFLFAATPKSHALEIQLLGTCVTTCVWLIKSHLQQTASGPTLWYNKALPLLPVYRTVSQVIKKMLLSNPNSVNSNRDCFLSTECVYVGVTGQHSISLWHITMLHM
jgi:hypothetical protein